VAERPQTRVGKIPVECPRCGFTQAESVFAKSTICRKCGHHVDLERLRQPDEPETKSVSLIDRFSKFISREESRRIECFGCGHPQTVSSAATSSICPSCSTYIDLRDFKITSAFNRAIQTQGSVHVTSRGDLSSPKIACGSAVVEGKLRGNLLCNGKTQMRFNGKIYGSIETRQLEILKGSDIEFVRPIKVKEADISGKISARIMSEGVVRISKTGSLEGTVYAKSMVVERGGVFHGELYIGKREMAQAELLPSAGAEPNVGLQQASLAFG
jgi:cytoskeletal protein CcmA (bactofilin family)